MILNDEQIAARCECDPPMIAPFVPEKRRKVDLRPVVSFGLGHFGYDLTLASDFRFISGHMRGVLDPHSPDDSVWTTISDVAYFDIPPCSFVLTRSAEYIRMPPDVVAIVTGKSTYARNGVIANVTPMEPGREGYLTIELSNTAPVYSRVWAGEGIVQCMFFTGDEPRLRSLAPGDIDRVVGTLRNAATTDGGHHKQYFIAHALKLLGVDVSDVDGGVAP